MSHSVTITRTVTTSNTTSTLILNTGYLKTLPGLLKLAQLLIGAACVGLILYHYQRNYYTGLPDLFFLLMATTFAIGTFCLLVSCLFSLSTGGIISKTIYELIYHFVAAVLLLIASIYLLVKLQDYKSHNSFYKAYTAAGALGIINVLLYLWSTLIARKTYRGI